MMKPSGLAMTPQKGVCRSWKIRNRAQPFSLLLLPATAKKQELGYGVRRDLPIGTLLEAEDLWGLKVKR